jgi:hypothetical protein
MKDFYYYEICNKPNVNVFDSGVMVSVLAIRLKVRRFKPGQGDGFLRAIKSSAHFHSEGKKTRRPHVTFFGM